MMTWWKKPNKIQSFQMMFYYTIKCTRIAGSNVRWKVIESWTNRIHQKCSLSIFLFLLKFVQVLWVCSNHQFCNFCDVFLLFKIWTTKFTIKNFGECNICSEFGTFLPVLQLVCRQHREGRDYSSLAYKWNKDFWVRNFGLHVSDSYIGL